jgi:hypothetical protein
LRNRTSEAHGERPVNRTAAFVENIAPTSRL